MGEDWNVIGFRVIMHTSVGAANKQEGILFGALIINAEVYCIITTVLLPSFFLLLCFALCRLLFGLSPPSTHAARFAYCQWFPCCFVLTGSIILFICLDMAHWSIGCIHFQYTVRHKLMIPPLLPLSALPS